jgi:hypothetical protein
MRLVPTQRQFFNNISCFEVCVSLIGLTLPICPNKNKDKIGGKVENGATRNPISCLYGGGSRACTFVSDLIHDIEDLDTEMAAQRKESSQGMSSFSRRHPNLCQFCNINRTLVTFMIA